MSLMTDDVIGVLDLPHDALLHILTLLSVPDICRCGLSCTKLRSVAREEEVWKAACSALIKKEHGYHSIRGESVAAIKAWMQASSFGVMYKVLWRLGCWPEGVWRAVEEMSKPSGRLEHVICAPNGKFMIYALLRGDRECREREYSLHETGFGWPQFIYDARDSQGYSFIYPLLGKTPREQTDPPRMSVLSLFTNNTPRGTGPPQQASCLEYCCATPAPPWPDSLSCSFCVSQAFNRLQGVWKTSYGPHGTEHVWVRLRSPPLLPPPGCPVAGSRLEGVKITGDPNVPSGQHTFVISSQGPVVGAYDGTELEEGPNGVVMPINRTIVMFKPGLMETVDLAERPVAGRYQGFGQINASTAVWAPEWTEVQLLVYEDTRALFSVLWSDLGSPFRHMMDFVPVPKLAQRTSLPKCLPLIRPPSM